MVSHVEHHEDNDQNDGYDNLKTCLRANLVFVLSAPFDVVSGRHRHAFRDNTFRLLDKAAHVAATNIHKDGTAQQAILTADHRRPDGYPDSRHIPQWNRNAVISRYENIAQGIRVFTEVTGISDPHRVTFTPLHGGRNVLAANRDLNNILNVTYGNAAASGGLTINFDL